MIYYILSNFIVSLSLVLEILTNMFIEIVYSPGCDVRNVEINLFFRIKLFFYMIKRSRHKYKFLENEKSL